MQMREFKIEIYIPKGYVKKLGDELSKVNVGKIGNYDHCMSINKVQGYWRPLEGADPFDGEVGKLCKGEECKVEVRCKREYVEAAMKIIRKVHPYEEPVINVIPLLNELFE
ncbi:MULTISPECIES: YqfO family protein [Clostridium]|uniref:Nif3-like dinuclear metal center hexameric protein n=1 Tax=Clostridium TaxID=1485 RepID=UPI000824D345|nr:MULTISPECIES: YqfO family protein [Clostridium]PJI10333.1 cytochrome C biogenesis protein [Clostridium sp. CT7]